MALRGKANVTDSSGATTFGPQVVENTPEDFTLLINRGPDRAYITGDGANAVDDTGFNLEPNEAISTKELPRSFRDGSFKAVCASGETATIYWARA